MSYPAGSTIRITSRGERLRKAHKRNLSGVGTCHQQPGYLEGKMKKMLLAAMLCLALLMLTACGQTSISLTTGIITDWVSPDGVHYWISVDQRGAMAPRYGEDGRLVIDK